MRKSALVVINPEAGGFKRESVLGAIRRHFSDAGIAYEIHDATRGETLAGAVREGSARGCTFIVVAGGDGTVSRTAAALADSPVPLGIVPAGTGNILARDLQIPLDTGEAVRLLCAPHETRTIDAMRIDGRLYILTAGVGISSLTVRDIRRSDKRRFGLLAYVGTAIHKTLEFKSKHFEVVIDGEMHRFHSPEVAVANSGGVVEMVLPWMPDIRIDDGALDVVVVIARGLSDYPRLVFNILRRRATQPDVRFLRAKRSVIIRPDKPLPVQADGDVVGTSPVEIQVVPRAVRVIVPPGTSPAATARAAT
jgi:diacylglycerol kinase (ATP)